MQRKIHILSLISFITLLLVAACSDPLSEKDKATLVRTLIEGTIEPGKYVIYWNGKAKDKSQVNPGAYICKFWAREYGDDIEMTALAVDPNRRPHTNDSTMIDYNHIPLHFFLDENHPDPFYVNEGTNILFDIPYRAEVLLTIHRKE